MSVLNLRISNDKRKSAIKQPYKEVTLIKVINKLETTVQNNDGFQRNLEELKIATNVEQQLNILKQLTRKYVLSIQTEQEDDDSHANELLHSCVHLLVEIYLSMELKSPLRSGVGRIISSLPENIHSHVCSRLSQSLRSRFEEHNLDIITINVYANALNGCFDNFPLGLLAITKCQDEAIEFIVKSFQICILHIMKQMTPVQKVDICQCTHTIVRAAICILQKCKCSCPPSLQDAALQLVTNTDLPLDTRTNCGLLVVLYTSIFCDKQSWFQLFEKYSEQSCDTSALCIYSGILSVIPIKELNVPAATSQTCSSSKTVVELMFHNLLDIENRNATNSVIILSVSRTVSLLSRCLLTQPSLLPPVLSDMLSYVWAHLDHYMDSVRHLSVTTLECIMKFDSFDVDVVNPVIQAVLQTPVWRRAKHAGLSALIGHIPVEKLLSKIPDLILSLLDNLQHHVVASHVVSSYEALMCQHYREQPNVEMWSNLWIKPMVSALNSNHNVALQQVLTKAINICPDIMDIVMKIKNTSLGTILLCLQISRKLGLHKQVKENKRMWRGLVDCELLFHALSHSDEQVRLTCLSLLVESPKTCEAITAQEFELVKYYLIYNLNTQATSSRQHGLSLINKFLTRFKDSSPLIQRKINQLEKKGFTAAEEKKLLSNYNDFCEWLINFCMINLFPGASFSRRISALYILNLCKTLNLWPDSANTIDNGCILLSCLADTYEENKLSAVQLIAGVPAMLPEFQDPEQVPKLISECIKLGSSVRPPDCATAAYLFKVVVSFPFSTETFVNIAHVYEQIIPLHMDKCKIVNREVYCCLLIVMHHLTEQLKIAQHNLLKAAASGPMYGLLFVAQHLLSQINFEDIVKNKEWRVLIKNLMELSFTCNSVVASVVNSSSPEGHIPMDFDFDISDLVINEDDSNEELGVTAQMVLLCAWRTVKEVSLLLGALAELAPVATNESEIGILSQDDLMRIGYHLSTLLGEIKHRGAFEQAYVGFCKLARRLWRFTSGDLHELPHKWLSETMHEIRDGDKFCATRRSAGIPYMVQALICTELEMGSSNTLQTWLGHLLELAECTASTPETRTHAFNVLRALFRNMQLGEVVGPFVEHAIMVAVEGFNASTWPERNSATLLLSTLVSRVFGVPRSKGYVLNWKNKMTGRIFFQRYPKLFGFFKNQLSIALLSFKTSTLHPTLYPVLLFLGRLYPSSLEGTDSSLQLSEYVEYIHACSSSNVFKTRILAAAAMVPLIPPNTLVQHLNRVFLQISSSEVKKQTNLTHGLLLQIIHFLQNNPQLLQEEDEDIESYIESWISMSLVLLNSSRCSVICECLIQIFVILSVTCYSLVSFTTWQRIVDIVKAILEESSGSVGYCLCQQKAAELLVGITLMSDQYADMCIPVINKLLKHPTYEVIHIVLDIIFAIVHEGNFYIGNDEKLLPFITKLPVVTKCEVKNLILNSESTAKLIAQNLVKSEYSDDLYKCLLVAYSFPLVLTVLSHEHSSVVKFLVLLCREQEEKVVSIAIYCIGAYLSLQENISDLDISEICDILNEYSDTSYDDECRLAVAHVLTKNFTLFITASTPVIRMASWCTLVSLACDDEPAVREIACSVAASDQVCSRSLELLLKKFTASEQDCLLKAVVLLSWILGDFTQVFKTEELPKGRVFDKSEMNCHEEEYILSCLAGSHFKNILSKVGASVMKESLDSSVKNWLCQLYGFSADNLEEFLFILKSSISKLDVSGLCSFVKPGYQATKLSILKLQNVVT